MIIRIYFRCNKKPIDIELSEKKYHEFSTLLNNQTLNFLELGPIKINKGEILYVERK